MNTAKGFGPSQAWNIWRELPNEQSHGTHWELYDTVFWSPEYPAEDVKRSLIEHDNYPPDIKIKRA